MNYKPFCETELLFTSKKGMENKLNEMDVKNIVLVMSESAAHRWNMDNFINGLKRKCKSKLKGNFMWIKSIATNPTQKDIFNALDQIGDVPVDAIFAFGGGSAIDLAKGISVFHSSNYSIEEITQSIKSKDYRDASEFVDIIAIPSTAGTGSEITQWATIWDKDKSGKFSIDAPELKPKLAIIVPELTLTLPNDLTLSTGLDAMSHAMEAYWSKYTTPLVQDLAYRAVELIVENLKRAVMEPQNLVVRERLCRASLLAGLAFSQTRTTACHSISYPLTMLYDIPHGFAVALTLEAVAKINRGNFPNDNELFKLFSMEVKGKYTNIESNIGIMKWIDDTCEGIIDLRLSNFGITKEDIPHIVDRAFTGGRMDNNPVELDQDDVKKILMSVFE